MNPISYLNESQIADESLALIAKEMYLKACKINPTSESWLGTGRACFALSKLDEAEDAFAEANVLNNRDANVWAHLALLCLVMDRTIEASQSINQALRLGIKDAQVLRSRLLTLDGLGLSFLNEDTKLLLLKLCVWLVNLNQITN
jgi:Flp pilus assembly protein TadD